MPGNKPPTGEDNDERPSGQVDPGLYALKGPVPAGGLVSDEGVVPVGRQALREAVVRVPDLLTGVG